MLISFWVLFLLKTVKEPYKKYTCFNVLGERLRKCNILAVKMTLIVTMMEKYLYDRYFDANSFIRT